MRMHSNCCASLQGSSQLLTVGIGEILVALRACTKNNGKTTWWQGKVMRVVRGRTGRA